MSPSYQHSYVCTNLGSALKALGKYSIFTELTLMIEKDYIPDICVYPKRNIRFGAEDIIKMTEMPLTAIEILSPSQTMQDALDKFKVYFGAGVKSCWLVTPPTMTVNVYTTMDQVQIFHTGDVVDPVLDIQCPINVIFE